MIRFGHNFSCRLPFILSPVVRLIFGDFFSSCFAMIAKFIHNSLRYVCCYFFPYISFLSISRWILCMDPRIPFKIVTTTKLAKVTHKLTTPIFSHQLINAKSEREREKPAIHTRVLVFLNHNLDSLNVIVKARNEWRANSKSNSQKTTQYSVIHFRQCIISVEFVSAFGTFSSSPIGLLLSFPFVV